MPARWSVQKSALYIRQLTSFAVYYRNNPNAGIEVSNRFVNAAQEATQFIQHNPMLCPIYAEAKIHPLLCNTQYRKWRLKKFPHSIFFRVLDDDIILIETIYAQRMNIINRLTSDINNRNE